MGFFLGVFVGYGKEFDFNYSTQLLPCVACLVKGAFCMFQNINF